MQKSQSEKKQSSRTSRNTPGSQKPGKSATLTAPQARVETEAKDVSTKSTLPLLNDEEITSESIARCAYLLWEKEGHQQGLDKEYWLKAESILRKQSIQN